MSSSFRHSFTDKFWLVLFLTSLVLMGVGASFLWRWREPVKLEIISAQPQASDSASIWVDVQGAVAQPGVYQLPSQARVKDALIAAGGLTEEADREVVARTINLAAPLKDGDKLYLASINQEDSQQVAGLQTGSNLINLNTASSSQLESLPGIGPVRAQAIIDQRPYTRIEEVQLVIPDSVYQEIVGQLSVY